ncbi:MAG TPA: hypothetical protein PLG77_05210 [Burkholderiaceae bacterium]|nr:hypothetical protein [Burkholderiaceae bacterium]HRP27810.1 hypothetical protein [Burkholderiaceae bacterium]
MWARLSDGELIAGSDLIVMGEWLGETQVAFEGMTRTQGVGVVAISEVLKGQRGPGFVLVERPGAGALRSSSDPSFERGQKGLWLLRAKPGGAQGIYLADNPQRFVSESGDPGRIATLKRLIGKS